MKKQSAKILLYRKKDTRVEFFLVHPGGPFWAKKDAGVWSLPGGEHEEGEDALSAAKREFYEETGFSILLAECFPLSSIKQKSGKVINAFACEGDCDPTEMISNTCLIDWPPKSGKKMEIPECDRGGWFVYEEAKQKISAGQLGFIEELLEKLNP